MRRGAIWRRCFGGTPANAGGEVDVITHATAYEMERRETARLANDAEWKRIMQGDERFSRAAWDGYRNARNEVWNAAHGDIVSTYGKAGRALDELRAGARPAADVLAGYGIESGTARAERALAAVRERAAANASTFEGTVNTLRARYDAAQNELARQAARTVEANPELGQDVVDVLLSVKRDTDKRFDRALTYGEVQLARKDASEITLAEYSKLMDAEWQSAFEFARARWTEYGQAQLRGLELGRSGIAQDLQSLGYTGDELKRLVGGVSDGSTRAEAQQIVSERRVAARASTPVPSAAASASQWEGRIETA